MRRTKMLCIALAPWITGAMFIVIAVVTKGQLLSMLLGHEVIVAEGGGASLLAAVGTVTAGIVVDCAAIEDRNWWQIGRRIKLYKVVVWSSVACILLWTALLLIARVSWESPMAWLTEGCLMLATRFCLPYVLYMILITILRATKWAWGEIAKGNS